MSLQNKTIIYQKKVEFKLYHKQKKWKVNEVQLYSTKCEKQYSLAKVTYIDGSSDALLLIITEFALVTLLGLWYWKII